MKKRQPKPASKSLRATPAQSKKKTAAQPPTQSMARLHFRPRTDEDDSFISSITLLTLKDVFEASTNQPLTEAIILQLVNQTDTCVIIEQRGKPIGYYCYDKTSADRIYWGSLVLVPSKQAKGLGRKVVEHFVAEAKKQGVRRIDGHVQVKNEEAYHFWMSNGFQVAGREQNGSVPILFQIN
ncbi:acetyltransferase (GNAT) family protein [Tumebacillus sp. BK434]|uniref:GNAT family N-acetyltransferase n=1 Tax=Tumebacillus sp. BK434 TaxID=2512169 RepID=UPI001043A001|nr:GNAT family N-acetyltransferase [Tumebacillus sp. BK434]TCP53272.1 acetyltransferase (GNAT) family protein [Tumebacillus sp. BK434]